MSKRNNQAFAANEAQFSLNFVTHLFSEMRYELNGFEIDRSKTPGISSMLKCLTACKTRDKRAYGLYILNSLTALRAATYRMCIPLRFVFGFCDDYNKIVLNCKHELILVRSRSNLNAYRIADDTVKITMKKIHWKMPHVLLSDEAKLNMLKTITRNEFVTLSFRSWDLYELPVVPQTTRHSWSVKTTTQVTKPRYIFVAFQTNKNLVAAADASLLDHCNISDVKLYLNNERYPYDDMNLNFAESSYHELYLAFSKIQQTYYNGTKPNNPVEVDYAEYNCLLFDRTR